MCVCVYVCVCVFQFLTAQANHNKKKHPHLLEKTDAGACRSSSGLVFMVARGLKQLKASQ
jgi:hypothetical protein